MIDRSKLALERSSLVNRQAPAVQPVQPATMVPSASAISASARVILSLSSGTIGTIIAMSRYDDIDRFQQSWYLWELSRNRVITWQESFHQYMTCQPDSTPADDSSLV